MLKIRLTLNKIKLKISFLKKIRNILFKIGDKKKKKKYCNFFLFYKLSFN
jgi:hypothetical protein